MQQWSRAVVGVVAASSLLTGCGSSMVGDPTSSTESQTASVKVTPAADKPWDPCTIPDSAVEAAGLDVDSKSTNLFGDAPLSTDWKTCIWTDPDPGSWYFLGVFSSDHDLAYLKSNEQFSDFTAPDSAGAVQFRRTASYD